MTMIPAQIIANECLALISTPLLDRFLARALARDERWAEAVQARLESVLGPIVPLTWSVALDEASAPALFAASRRERDPATLGLLLVDPADRERELQCVPLLLAHGDEHVELPQPDALLSPGDKVLFAGTARARSDQSMMLRNANVYAYVKHGTEVPGGWVWHWLTRRQVRSVQAAR
jgi:hypothetical protein